MNKHLKGLPAHFPPPAAGEDAPGPVLPTPGTPSGPADPPER
jgi:hypothetical protein